MQVLDQLPKTVFGVSMNPLAALRPRDMEEVPPGQPYTDYKPDSAGRVGLRVNGEWINPEHWACRSRPGDVIEWHLVPQDKEDFRTILQVAAIVVSIYAPYLSPYLLAANVAYNVFVPPDLPVAPVAPGSTSEVFSASLSGNQARLDQPVWKVCGHQEINPPYACQPYYETLPKPGATDTELDRDQYFYGVFAVTVGNAEVVAKIGNTPLSRFSDIVLAQYLAPGVQPSQVKVNVATAIEVSGQVLDTARRVGGFAACAAKQQCNFFGVDVLAGRGLGKIDSALTVEWRVQYREINDFGQVLGVWITVAEESRTAFTSTPQRWTNTYELPSAMRIEVSVIRTDVKDTDARALHEIAWSALRAYRNEPVELDPNVAHYELVLRASSQLSNLGSRDFRLITDAYVRTWSTADGWGAEVLSRNPMWWCLELISNPVWGIGQPDDRIDFASFEDIATICDARQDRFDYTFDSTMNAWDALQLIARTARCRVFRRNGVISIARDELATVGVTAFSPRNCMQASMTINEKLRDSTSADGFIVTYRDHRTGDWTAIECPCPGVAEMTNPVYMQLDGVIGETHARREGMYQAANLLYRSRTVDFTTEMQGMLPAFMSPVRFAAEIPGYASSGDIALWDEATLTATLTEPADFSEGSPYITLIRDDGSLTAPVAVLPGANANEVILPALPDFDLVVDDGTRERPKYLLGVVGADDIVKISSIRDGGKGDEGEQLYSISGVIDDPRVHAADNALLPSPSEIQDPIGYPDEDAGGGFVIVPNLPGERLLIVTASGPYATRYLFNANGTTQWVYDGVFNNNYPNEWIIGAPVEVVEAAQFEVMFHSITGLIEGFPDVSGDVVYTSPTMDTWLPGGVDYAFDAAIGPTTGDGGGQVHILLRITIRDAATLIVLEEGQVDLVWDTPETGGGGN